MKALILMLGMLQACGQPDGGIRAYPATLDLSAAGLTGLDLRSKEMSLALLQGASLGGSGLSGAWLRGADLSWDSRLHGGKNFIVTTIAREVWERKLPGRFTALGSAATLMRERSPGRQPFLVAQTSSIENGQIHVGRFFDLGSAMLAMHEDFAVLAGAFTDLFSYSAAGGDDGFPAA